MISNLIRQVVLILLFCHFLIFDSTVCADEFNLDQASSKTNLSVFPIFMYDSDIGFGLGGKCILKNYLEKDESFDLILFGSTKGEQWYVLTFSFPDPKLRHGTLYPISLDLKCEYDRYLKSNFFGFGNNSKDNEKQFPKEFTKLELTLGHAFPKQIVGESGLFFNHTSIYDYDQNDEILNITSKKGESINSYLRFLLRWDTRNNQIHPESGYKSEINLDFALKQLGSDYTFNRYIFNASMYNKLFSSNHILATRIQLQLIDGNAPYFEQSVIGGTWFARGYKADRFIDKSMSQASIEYRYQFHKWMGAVFFVDSGRVYRSLTKLSLHEWHNSYGTGLRIYPGDFVVRFDIGISNEGTRMFFNFGHVF